MSKQELAAIAKALVAPGKGLLAMDESNRTCNKRFEDIGIAPTEKNRPCQGGLGTVYRSDGTVVFSQRLQTQAAAKVGLLAAMGLK